MSRFFSRNLQDLEAYTPGEQPKKGQYIKLNTNENPFPPPKRVAEVVEKSCQGLHLYSDDSCRELTETYANYRNVSPKNVLFANGSDEILAFSFLAFCQEGVCFPDISYGFYPVFAQLFQIEGEKIPLAQDLSIQTKDYFQKRKTVLIANPNAPTGIALSLGEIQEIVQQNPNNLVIIDEAYVDFGGESAVPLTKKYDNLLVCGTFSKSRNLAGARLGFAIGQEELIADLNKIKYSFNPYNVNSLSQAVGKVSIEEEAYFQDCCRNIISTREDFTAKLQELCFFTLPSKANFIFTKTEKISGEKLFQGLKERNILVRHFTNPLISDFLRITIGTKEEMEIVLKNIKEMVE
ncbi:MAG: histidinol-phosphate transaminase [Eubacteriales bacterium]